MNLKFNLTEKETEFTKDSLVAAMALLNDADIDKGISELYENERITDGKLTERGKHLLESAFMKMQINEDDKKLAQDLKSLWPKGKKPGTTKPWTENIETTTMRIKKWKDKFKVNYSNEEIFNAAKNYVEKTDPQYLRILSYFIMKQSSDGCYISDLLTLLEDPTALEEMNTSNEFNVLF